MPSSPFVRSALSSSAILVALSAALLRCSAEPSSPDVPSSSERGGAPARAGSAGEGASSKSGGGGSADVASGGGSSEGGASAGVGGAMAGSAGARPAGGGEGGGSGGTAGVGGLGGSMGLGGSGGSTSSSCGAGAILCEDFEAYPAASAPSGGWTASTRGNGKVVVDATRAFTGKQSLHVTGKMNADRANISRSIQTDSPSAYVRFMYFGVSYPASSGVHTRLMRIGTAQAASGNPDSSYSLASYNGTAIEKVNSIYLRDTATKLNAPALLNRWTCLEFAIDRSGGVGKVEVQLWVDGRELPLSPAGSSSHGMTSPSWDPIPFELFMLGLDGFQADTQAADFWIDDLSVTPQRVGCQTSPP